MNAKTRTYTMVLATFWLVVAGCSGDSGGGDAREAPTMPVAQPTTPKPTARGTLVVTVTDLLGAPVPGAQIDVSSKWPDEHRSVIADANGRAEITGVIDDAVTIRAYATAGNEYSDQGHLNLPSLGGQGTVNAYVEIEPAFSRPLGITAARVVADGVRNGGRTLEFSLGLLRLGDSRSATILDCLPDTTNDGSRFQPDCVAGAEGFDASYAVLNNGESFSNSTVDVCCYDGMFAPSLTSTLLLDQSGTVTSSDPSDYRLFVAKYFLTWGQADRRLSLAAFAAKDAATGQPALLPQQPLTIFPVENPVVGAAGRELFSTVDTLGTLEGGGAPLYDALDRLIDFAAPGPDERATIFVVTDGRDTTCGTYSQCKERRRQVLQKSRDRKVTITTIGVRAAATGADREALGALSQGSYNGEGAAFWGFTPATVRTALLNQRWPEPRRDATFQIQAPTAGTFASGRTVIGTVRVRECPEFCGHVEIPFTVEIP